MLPHWKKSELKCWSSRRKARPRALKANVNLIVVLYSDGP
jgi:hypothetical protein